MKPSPRVRYTAELPTLLHTRLLSLTQSLAPHLKLSDKEYAVAVLICERILTALVRKLGLLHAPIQIPSNYFRRLDNNYSKALNKLIAAEVLYPVLGEDGRPTFSIKKGVCKAYYFNSFLISSESSKVEITVTANAFKKCIVSDFLNSNTIADLYSIEFNSIGARQWLEWHIKTLSISKWLINENSAEYRNNARLINVRESLDGVKSFNEIAVNRAKYLIDGLRRLHPGKELFKLSKGYVVATPEEFLARKRKTIHIHYSHVIQKLENKDYWTRQSTTNNRLHHNLTELPKKLLPFVTLNGEPLVEVDISNSQIALLAHIMQYGDVLGLGFDFPPIPETMSTARFQSEARRGVIYDQLASLILDNDRDAAKAEIILWLFSGAGYNPKRDSALYKRYEDVIKWVRQVKKMLKAQKGTDTKLNLAVYLQRFEADLMLNYVYPVAKENGYVLFSKHDSFLVPASDAQDVQELMIKVLQSKGVTMQVRYKAVALRSTRVAA